MSRTASSTTLPLSFDPVTHSPTEPVATDCGDAAHALDHAAQVVKGERPDPESAPRRSLDEAAVRFADCVRDAGATPEAMLRQLKARLWPHRPGEDRLHFEVVREAIRAYFRRSGHP